MIHDYSHLEQNWKKRNKQTNIMQNLMNNSPVFTEHFKNYLLSILLPPHNDIHLLEIKEVISKADLSFNPKYKSEVLKAVVETIIKNVSKDVQTKYNGYKIINSEWLLTEHLGSYSFELKAIIAK